MYEWKAYGRMAECNLLMKLFFQVGNASQGRDDQIHDYAQALIKIKQTSKPSLHMAAQSEDEVST